MGCCDPVYSEREPSLVHRLVEVVADLECEGMIVIVSEADCSTPGPWSIASSSSIAGR